MKNVTTIDRFIRLVLAVTLFELAFFWLSGVPGLVAYVLAAVMLVTSVWGFCPLYRVLGLVGQRTPSAPTGLAIRIAFIILLLGVALGGSYSSYFFTRKIFLEDFSAMNPFYKQTLFLTGKGERDKAVTNYGQLVYLQRG
jgi:hypothetical protein